MSAPLNNPRGPPSEKQLAALRRFGAKPENVRGLTKEMAAEWLEYLVSKVRATEELTDADLSHFPETPEPEIRPASTMAAPPTRAAPAPAVPERVLAGPPNTPHGASPTDGRTLWIEVIAWIPASRASIVIKALEEARAGFD